MGNTINGQSNVQQHNKLLNNDQPKANFTGANQMPMATPMSQTQILNQLMSMIQQLISALQGDDTNREGSNNTNASADKKKEETGGKPSTSEATSGKIAGKIDSVNPTNTSNTSTPSGMPNSPTGETTVDTGTVYKDPADGATARTAGGQASGTPTGQSNGQTQATGQPASLAGITTDYNTKFNIDPTMRDCPSCINEFTVDQTHTASSGVPYRDPSDHIPTANQTDREWGEVTINNHFQNTFNVPPRTAPETYKGGTLVVEVSRPQVDPAGPNNSNDSIHVVENGGSIGGESIWSGPYASQTTRTVTINLTPAQAASANDGDFSFLVEDDTTVHSAVLHLEGGTPIPSQNGTTSDDDLKGKTGQPDIIHGLEGDDTIDGESGDDCLYGDQGDDHIRGGSGDDKAFGGTGDDILEGGSGEDKLFGNEGDDKIFGGSGDDIMFGDEGSDELHGGSGDDKIFALDGDDVVFGDSGDDEIYSGLGPLDPTGQHNIIDGGSGDDTVHYSGMYDANDPANSDYFVNTIGPNEWEVIDKQTGKRDIIKNVEHLVFEMNPGGPFTLDITSDK
ncbi:MAG: hypothetical protein KAH03_05070 [Cocleimonas sp.]|nr:hypothetical protein [Cocleimonas sp.]